MNLPNTKSPFEQEDHFRFAFVADEWLALYSDFENASALPRIFAMVMTFELYLKAYHSKLTVKIPDAKNTTKFSHRCDLLLNEISRLDKEHFPSLLKFNLSLLNCPLYELDRNGWNCEWFKKLSEPDQNELRDNYEFYLIMAYGTDLKYGICPSLEKHGGRIISSTWSAYNPKLAEMVTFIRNRIGFPDHQVNDLLKRKLEQQNSGYASSKFLRNIIDRTNYQRS